MKQLRITILLLFSFLPVLTNAGDRPLIPYSGEAKGFSLADQKGNQHNLEDYRGKVVLMNFWASWCQPCQVLMPVLAKLADDYQGKFLLGKLNTEEEQEIAAQFGIRSIPTMVVFKGGQEVARQPGAMMLPQILQWVETNA